FSIGRQAVRGGVYGIARAFSGLTLNSPGLQPIALRDQFEAGVSVSTAPEIRIWKVTLPWIAVGYQFGPVVAGVRIYTSFPFLGTKGMRVFPGTCFARYVKHTACEGGKRVRASRRIAAIAAPIALVVSVITVRVNAQGAAGSTATAT